MQSADASPPRLAALVDRWRTNAALLRSYGAPGHARLLERLAADLEAELAAESAPVVDLAGAVFLSGYSRAHLRRLLRTGRLLNQGTDDAPRFNAADLPRKPGIFPPEQKACNTAQNGLDSRLQVARAVVSGD